MSDKVRFMNYGTFSLLFLLATTLFSSAANAVGYISTNEIQPFASKFRCDNPKLQWQFAHTISLWSENERMKSLSRNRKESIISDASGVGGEAGWLYRGVTNQQFNESQILALIFNDSTQVSESRWFSTKMLKKAAVEISQFVAARTKFREIPLETRWDYFKNAYEETANEILALANQNPNSNFTGFWPHLQIGNSLNGTPQAIQFLTPHKRYAEGYGEFVLHIREVVQRGVDVERYNYHNPDVSYSIGSIYQHDRDEYLLPSHIPSWDVQVVKVRGGREGWHQGDYGSPIYYFTKMYEDSNPCAVTGVRIDSGDDDSNRKPVGVLMKCSVKNSGACPSMWDGALGSNESRLKRVVQETKVDDYPLYYMPWSIYQEKDPRYLESFPLLMAIERYPSIKENFQKDASLWKKIFLRDGFSNLSNSLNALNTIPVLTQARTEIRAAFEAKICRNSLLHVDNVDAFYSILLWTGTGKTECVQRRLMELAGTKRSRAKTLELFMQHKSNPALAGINYKALEAVEVNIYEDLKPYEAITAIYKDGKQVKYRAEVVRKIAAGISFDPDFVTKIWSTLGADISAIQDLFEEALLLSSQQPHQYPLRDPFLLWSTIRGPLAGSPHPETLLGQCIDYAITSSRLDPAQLAEKVAICGLPKEREIDTIRSLWQKAKSLPGGINRYRFYAMDLVEQFVKKTISQHTDQKASIYQAFSDFFMENISPPAPFLGFASILNLHKMTETADELVLWPEGESMVIKINGQDVVIGKVLVQAALGHSVSLFYLNKLLGAYKNIDDAAKKKKIAFTLANVVKGYKTYLLANFEADYSDPFSLALLKERYDWKKNENMIDLITIIANLKDTTDAEKAALEQIRTRLAARIPEMTPYLRIEQVKEIATLIKKAI